jgi:hypothetical protein
MATGVANAMKVKFDDQLDLKILLNESEEAKNYSLKGSTSVFVDGEWVSIDVATSKENMESYLERIIS